MKVPNKVDRFRRNLMHNLTKQIGSDLHKERLEGIDVSKILRVLIVRPNHRLGNILLTTPLVNEIATRFPNATIDIITRGQLSPVVFQNYHEVKNFILLPRKPFKSILKYVLVWIKMPFKKYDLIINIVKCSSSGKLLTKITPATYKIYEYEEMEKTKTETIHHAKEAIIALRSALYPEDSLQILKEIPSLDLKLSKQELQNGKEKLNSLKGKKEKTIALFTFATGDKCYSKLWWSKFYSNLLSEFYDCNILEILPAENVSQIDFKATSFYSKDIREIASVMACCDIFVGADSGIMHLASSSGVPTIGLFHGRIAQFRPYGNGSAALDISESIMEDWMAKIDDILSLKINPKAISK
jgi:ADP-heptose:LPS heptosyltransferase